MNCAITKETMKMLWNTSFAPKNHTKNLCPWMVLLFLCISQPVLADNTGFIEIRADRMVRYRQLTGASVYGELRANKQFNGHWDVQLLWQDMFASRKSSLSASVRYNF